MADELIELGKPTAPPRLAGPYLAANRRPELGGAAAGYLETRLAGAVAVLAKVSGTPVRLLGAVPWAAENLGACLGECPALGALAAQAAYAAEMLGAKTPPGLAAAAIAARAVLGNAYNRAEAKETLLLGAPAGLRAALSSF